MKRFRYALMMLFSTWFLGCGAGDGPAESEEIDDLVAETNGKSDTGYMSTLATELEGEFVGKVVLDLADKTPEEREALVAEYSSSDRKVKELASQQLKFAKKKCNSEQLHMNLYSDEIVADSVELTGDRYMELTYRARLESIVSHEELEEVGRDISDVVGTTTVARVPADPRELFTRIGDRCAEGHDEGSLKDYNYFYYFAPDKEGCDIQLAEASFAVSSLAPPETTYPEYDRLAADGKVTVFVIFGAAGHDEEVSSWDWGVREWRDFKSDMSRRGFSKASDLEPGERYTRTRAGVEEIIDVLSPYDIYHNPESDNIFKRGISEHEVILYNGHSFYGSLSVLQDCSVYPENTYQIFHMGSCWSYEYYTRQIFECKKTDDDPTGWDLADIVNDTESGWFHNNAEFSRILLTNIFAGAETGGIDGDRYFTWFNIIAAMNKHALDTWRRWGTETHEIMGVSGVKNNKYDPEGGGPDPEGKTYSADPAVSVPDDDTAGVQSQIDVPDAITPAEITINVDITHTYVGDLVVRLAHGDVELTLQDQEGGSRDDLIKEFTVVDDRLLGTDAQGAWTLTVADVASSDEGTLNSWSITFTP